MNNVKSSWASKINWGSGITLLATVLTVFGIDLDADTQAAILALIAAGSAVYTWIMRTFFTTKLTKASVS